MGEVYLAQDQTLERNVALKILPPEMVRSEERVRRFELEAKSASSLSHPNIVTIYEIGRDAVRTPGEPDSNPVHFISMELVSGKTLSTLIHDDKTDLRTLLGYLAQAAEGLAKAHASGIVHRDLKPGNIMVSADGFAKVLDFGLAKLTEQREAASEAPAATAVMTDATAPTQMADATAEGLVVGTAGYMSPEQVQGRSVDHRADVFSFGCILYEAATRKRPFTAETGVETMHKILHDKPAPVEELNPRAPAELRRLIRRCLAKAPDQRLQSMKDLAIELREIVDEFEALSASASSGSMIAGAAPAPAARKTPVALWLGAGAVVVATLAFGAWWVLRSRPASHPFQTMRMSAQTSRGDLSDAALSPDGRFLAYLAGRAGSQTLRVRQVATGSDVEILPPSDAQIRNPSFSPDGNYLFYTAVRAERQNYQALFQVPSLGGTPRERAFDVDSRVSFSPDGGQLVFWRRMTDPIENRLVVLDLGSGNERVLATVSSQESFLGAPAWSPDGKRIAGCLLRPAPNLETAVALFDAADGRRRDHLKFPRTILSSLAWLRDGKGLVSTGQDLSSALLNQVRLHGYPEPHTTRITNDFNQYDAVSASLADETIAVIRTTRIANVWMADVGGAPPRRLTSFANPENSTFNALGLDAATVIYGAPDDRRLQVWTMGVTGSDARPLTSGQGDAVNAQTAAGVVIYDRLDSSGVHVWRVGADGSQRQLTSGAGEQNAQLSPDGRHAIVTHYDTPRKLTLISTEDGRVGAEWSEAAGTLGFSPDSRSVLLGRLERDERGLSYGTWLVQPVAGGPPTASIRLPDRAPDGRAVTFRNLADPAWNVYRLAFDGTPPSAVTRLAEGRITDFRWSPDGTQLAARVEEGVAANLWVVDADGSRPRKVTSFTADRVFSFNWMPDGRAVVLTAGTATTDAVLIREFR
jgi:Tol biopolymer transport system component/tRNA A-37 threonylcarbamoyl transferase component Bud32